MIRSRDVVEHLIDGFVVNNFSLSGLLVEDRILERFVLVDDLDVFLLINADGNWCAAHGIERTLRLDLVNNLVELDGQVVAENAVLLPSKNASQIVFACEWAMSIKAASWHNSEASIEIFDKFRQIGIASFPRRDAT